MKRGEETEEVMWSGEKRKGEERREDEGRGGRRGEGVKKR